MENESYIEIRITGYKGNLPLTPDLYDIRELQALLEQVDGLLLNGEKKDRPIISYEVAEGSVRHFFKTGLQYILAFSAIIGQISKTNSIDFLESPTAKSIESIQRIARSSNYNFEITTSLPDTGRLQITPYTNFQQRDLFWTDAEFYFYGKITNAGGKEKANIHISTNQYGIVRIQTPIEFLSKHEHNLLYKNRGVRAKGRQNVKTGQTDLSNLHFVEIIDYDSSFNENYLRELIDKAASTWSSVEDPDEWLQNVRGNYGE